MIGHFGDETKLTDEAVKRISDAVNHSVAMNDTVAG